MEALYFFRSSASKKWRQGNRTGPPEPRLWAAGGSRARSGPPEPRPVGGPRASGRPSGQAGGPGPPSPAHGPAGRSALADGLGDDPGDLLGGAEVGGEAVLGHREGGPGGGIGARPAPTDATDPKDAGGALGVAAELADAVPQPPGRRVPEDLVDTSHGHRRGLPHPLGPQQPDAVDLAQQRRVHAGDGSGGHLAAGGDVGHQDVRAVAELGGGHAEVQLAGDAQRPGHVLAQDLRDALAGRPADDLADDVAEGVGVVAGLGAGLPPGGGAGDPRAHQVPVAQVLGGGVGRDAGHAHRMGQGVPDGGGLLAVGAELRPQLDDGGSVAEQPALHEHVGDGRGRALADRVAVERRAGGHRPSGGGVGDAGDGVDHLLAVPVHGHLQAALGSGLDQLVDGLLHLLLKVVHDPLLSFPLASAVQAASAQSHSSSVSSTAWRSDRSTVTATAMAATTSTAAIRKASRYPPVSAAAVISPRPVSCWLRVADRVASTASPSAAPTCVVVLTSPEARPASRWVAPDIARVASAGKDTPMPMPISSIAGSTSVRYLPCTGTRATRPSPAAIRTRPGTRMVLALKRMISRSE